MTFIQWQKFMAKRNMLRLAQHSFDVTFNQLKNRTSNAFVTENNRTKQKKNKTKNRLKTKPISEHICAPKYCECNQIDAT